MRRIDILAILAKSGISNRLIIEKEGYWLIQTMHTKDTGKMEKAFQGKGQLTRVSLTTFTLLK